MRMMLKVTVPTDAGNRAMKDGTLQQVLQATMTKLNPEAAYFVADEGCRCAMLFFEMHHSGPQSPQTEKAARIVRSN